MNDLVNEYLKKKYGENFEADAQKQYDETSGNLAGAGFVGDIGSLIAGGKVGANDEYFAGLKKQAKANTLGKVEQAKEGLLKDYTLNKVMAEDQASAAQLKELSDINSPQTKQMQALASRMVPGYDFSKMSGADINKQLPTLKSIFEIEGKKAERSLDRDLKRQQIESMKVNKETANQEKMQGLQTPYGLANTVDDAKQLKEAYEAKKNFDNKIQQMIDLRQKHGGGAILNREDVARGKQLSKDLLLEYKNMAKLGVLSKADEDIINAIIPEDPLSYNSPIAAIQGQDPTLSRLKSFKSDSDKDFATRVSTRTREGIKNSPAQSVVTSPKDKQAIEWAYANPNDPRAVKILEKNGLAGGK